MHFNADEFHQNLHKDLGHIIDMDLNWSIDDSPKEVACYRLKESLLKKFNNSDRPSSDACDAALKKFLAVNERLRDWEVRATNDWEAELLSEFKIQVSNFWYRDACGTEPLLEDWLRVFLRGRVGPGASLLATGADVYRKLFCSPLSATPGLPDIWESCVTRCPQFLEAYCDPAWVGGTQVVDHNKLSFVNKTVHIARTICTEPQINMWFQLGVGDILHDRLKAWYGIDFSIQPEVNRRLALIGAQKGQLSTIDLESASDSMSLGMLKWALPRSFWNVLMKLRCRSSCLPDGSKVELSMVSTMGNGFTFPLQTTIFACAVRATYKYLRQSGLIDFSDQFKGPSRLRNAAVFGDDIIVHKSVTRHLVRLLELLGFVVNGSKTFVEGPFKESCGVDYFYDTDVRPFYLKRLASLQDAFVAINGLNRWSSKFGVPLRHCVRYIVDCFPKVVRCPVPLHEDDSAGLHLPRLRSTNVEIRREHSVELYRYTASVPEFFGYKVDVDKESLIYAEEAPYNPQGLYIAFLHGSIRGYRVSVRQTPVRYITKRRVTPTWDYLPPHRRSTGLSSREAVARLQWACDQNLWS
jgi:hypothetical protein